MKIDLWLYLEVLRGLDVVWTEYMQGDRKMSAIGCVGTVVRCGFRTGRFKIDSLW